jgi:tetratricopeptide (TPR) repeat protein
MGASRLEMARGAKTLRAMVVICALIGASNVAEASDAQCIDDAAREALSCEGLRARAAKTPKRFKVGAPKADPPGRPVGVPSAKSLESIERATPRRPVKHRDIEMKLLLQEVKQVERLLDVTPVKSKDHPRLLRRLGDDYVELASTLFRDQIHKEIFADEIKRLNPTRSRRIRRKAKRLSKRVSKARARAVKFYRRLADEHSKYCHLPRMKDPQARGCVDEVLYYLAYEHEQLDASDDARKSYLELVQNHPGSKYLPAAYLAFGELFFSEAQMDPTRWALARQAYGKVIAHPPPNNKLWAYAHYKLGYIDWNESKHGDALDHFRQVIEALAKHPDLPNALGLAEAARRDMVPVYALSGEASKAWGFFAPLSGDRPGDKTKTIALVEQLGQALLDIGQHSQAVDLYRLLLKRGPSDRSCAYRGAIAKATMAEHASDKRRIVATLIELADDHDDPARDAKEQLRCANLTASMLTETAMSWHIEAVGSGGVRGTDSPATMNAAHKLYERVSKTFSASNFAKFKFPHLVKEDWPTLTKVRYAQADLAFHRNDWAACGAAFTAAYEADPNDPDAPEALFAAAQCWQQLVISKHSGDSHHERLTTAIATPQPLEGDTAKMLSTLDRYACVIAPPKNDDDALGKYVDVLYARARAYYERGHFAKAALAFRTIAIDHPESEAAPFAANLYLDALEVMRSSWKRPGCVEPMKQDVPRMLKSLCSGNDDDDVACKTLGRVSLDLRRIDAEATVALADQGGPKAKARYASGCSKYLSIWKDHGAKACRDEEASCARNEEILFNAARACQAGHLVAKAISIRKILLDPSYHLESTELAKEAAYEIGAAYQAIAIYDQAAGWYERYAASGHDASKGATALSDAVVLRLGLGQHQQALTAARSFDQRFGRTQPRQAAQIAFAVGHHHAEHARWRDAKRTLERSLQRIDKHGSPEIVLQTWSLLGRTHVALERRREADKYFAKAAKADVAKLKKRVEALDGTPRQNNRKLGRALDAMGEALFHFAEVERVRAEALTYPSYRGAGTVADVKRFIEGPVSSWLQKKKPAIEHATKAYMRVVELNAPAPPPRWAVASGAAVGGMWGKLVEDVMSAPYPKDWDQPGIIPGSQPPTMWQELRASYQAGLEQAVKPYRKVAKGSYTSCLEYGILYQYFDGELRQCEQWLGKNFPNEFHVVDELSDAPTRKSSPLSQRPPPLEIGDVEGDADDEAGDDIL